MSRTLDSSFIPPETYIWMPGDPFALALERFASSGRSSLRWRREDGASEVEDVSWYFTAFDEFLPFERHFLQAAKGPVLDVGCGAGRHSLYLAARGLEVISIDISPRIARLAASRGVQRVCVADACRALPFPSNSFETVLLLGNNLGICGTEIKTLGLLNELARLTRPGGKLVCSNRAPDLNSPREAAYWTSVRAKGRQIGELRFELRCGREQAETWLYLVSPSRLEQLAASSGWGLAHLETLDTVQEGYGAVLTRVRP